MSDIDLGFPEKRDSAWLTNRYFPSKIGGQPAWLELSKIPDAHELQCETCKNQLNFLCQIYAPGEDEQSFHRMIYVFVCSTPECQVPNSARNFKVLRCQLPLKNKFYSQEPPEESGNPLPAIESHKKLCLACGCIGPLSCGRCKKVNYCSEKHQKAHWKYHKKICTQSINSDVAANSTTASAMETDDNVIADLPDINFPEWEIIIETSEDASCSATSTLSAEQTTNDENKDNERLLEFEKLVAAGKTGTLADVPNAEVEKYVQSTEVNDDKFFAKFRKETSKDPEQIIRYKRNGLPLWIADVEKTVVSQLRIPICEFCGGPRLFEFQIMPQSLLLLKNENLDWGILAVYTCADSCNIRKDIGYFREYIVKQDILK